MRQMQLTWRVGPAPPKRPEVDRSRRGSQEEEDSSAWRESTESQRTTTKQPITESLVHYQGNASTRTSSSYPSCTKPLMPSSGNRILVHQGTRKYPRRPSRPTFDLRFHALQHGSSDSFVTTPVPLTAKDHDIIRNFKALFLHSTWPHSPGTDYRPILRDWDRQLSTILSSKACIHALLYTSAIWTGTKYSDAVQQFVYTIASTKHQVPFLASLRSELELEPASLPLIASIALVGVGLVLSGDSAAYIHYRALRPLVDAYGGFRSLPYATRGIILPVDHAAAVASMQLSKFPSSSWDPGAIFSDLSPVEKESYARSIHGSLPLSDDIHLARETSSNSTATFSLSTKLRS